MTVARRGWQPIPRALESGLSAILNEALKALPEVARGPFPDKREAFEAKVRARAR
jgi:hypothetical protein